MPTDNEDLGVLLLAFLKGDFAARQALPARCGPLLGGIARRLAPTYFTDALLLGDVVSRTWELLLRKPPYAFDPDRGTPGAYLATIVRTAVRDVRQENSRVATRSRDYPEFEEPVEYMRVPVPDDAVEDPSLEEVERRDRIARLLDGEPEALVAAVHAIAYEDATLGDAAGAAEMTRFSLKRGLVRWASRVELKPAA